MLITASVLSVQNGNTFVYKTVRHNYGSNLCAVIWPCASVASVLACVCVHTSFAHSLALSNDVNVYPTPTRPNQTENDEGTVVSPMHDIPLYANEECTVYNMVVEVPRWSNAKMEVITGGQLVARGPSVLIGPQFVREYAR